jgi:hypothetical protein
MKLYKGKGLPLMFCDSEGRAVKKEDIKKD